jgi:hypothetical protein
VQNVDGGPPGRRYWRIRECPPSTLRDIDDDPPGRC